MTLLILFRYGIRFMKNKPCKYEVFFILLLTQEPNCDIIAKAETTYNCYGDADAAAEAPPRLTSRQTSPICVVRWGEYYPS